MLANDSDPNDPTGALLVVTAVTQPSNGSVAIAPDGKSVIYTPPNATYKGKPKFDYTVSNGVGSASATVTVG